MPQIEVVTIAPPWLEELERTCFGGPWGAPAVAERLWVWAPIAFARWTVVPAAAEAELLRIAVDPAERQRGHGATLLRTCEQDLAAAGISRLFLEVREGNLPARRLYEGSGWRCTGRRPAYYRDGEAAVLYAKELASNRPCR